MCKIFQADADYASAPDMGGHALSMLGWGGAGALLFEMNRRNELLLDIKKAQLRQSVALNPQPVEELAL